MGKVLIIGAGGFIGRALSLELAGDMEIVGFDIAPLGSDATPMDWVAGPIADLSLVASAAAGCTSVVFLANASLPGSSQADLAREAEAHVMATLRVAETCRGVGVERFLFASSGGTVYGYDAPPRAGLHEGGPTAPRNAYGVSKLAIEHYLRLMGAQGPMRTLSLRISNPYGAGQRAIRGQGIVAAAMQHALEGKALPIWGDGTVERDFVHVSDVARAFAAGLRHDGPSSAINVGSGRAVSLNELLEMIRRITGRELPIDYLADRPVDVHRNVLSISTAAEELKWRPQIGLEEGLRCTASWWGIDLSGT